VDESLRPSPRILNRLPDVVYARSWAWKCCLGRSPVQQKGTVVALRESNYRSYRANQRLISYPDAASGTSQRNFH